MPKNISTPTLVALSITVLFLFVLMAFLAISETSLVRISRAKALALHEQKRKGSKFLLEISKSPSSYLQSILFAVFLAQTLAATIFGILVSSELAGFWIVLATALEIVLVFILAEAIPKNYAVNRSESAALLIAPLIYYTVTKPPLRTISRFLNWVSNKVLPVKDSNKSEYIEMELRAMADVAVEEEVIENQEGELIHSVLSIGDLAVRDVMRPRPEIIAIEKTKSVAEALELAIEKGVSRLPVYTESLDDISGFVTLRDLGKFCLESKSDQPVSALIREAKFVPETKRIHALLTEMQTQSQQIVMVCDEYGSTVGLVTLEDILEEIVGEIEDEADNSQQLIVKRDSDYLIDGRATVEEIEDETGVKFNEEKHRSISSLILDYFGRLPRPGQVAALNGIEFRVENVFNRRINKVSMHVPDTSSTAKALEIEHS